MTKKKQIVLAVIGVTIMLVLLVGSSYAALFSYEDPSLADVKENKNIVFDRPHKIEWITIPKTNLDEWFKYYIVEA